MKRGLLALLVGGLLLWGQPCAAAITRVQVTQGGSDNCGTSVVSNNFGSSVTSGNLVAVAVRSNDSSPTVTVADTVGTTYTNRATGSGTSSGASLKWYDGVLGSSGTNAVTITWSSGVTFCWVFAIEYSGQSGSPFDVGSFTSGTGTTDLTTGPFSTSDAGVIACAATQNALTSYTAGTNFTLVDGTIPTNPDDFGGVEEWVTSGAQSTFTAHLTSGSTNDYSMGCVSYHAATGGGGGSTPCILGGGIIRPGCPGEEVEAKPR